MIPPPPASRCRLDAKEYLACAHSFANDILQLPSSAVRVLTGDVGGFVGMKASVYPEYVCVLHAARALGRPIKWTADRFESSLPTIMVATRGLWASWRLTARAGCLALRFTGYANMGAYLGTVAPLMQTLNIVKNAVSVYRIPLIEVSTQCVFTNATLVVPIGVLADPRPITLPNG